MYFLWIPIESRCGAAHGIKRTGRGGSRKAFDGEAGWESMGGTTSLWQRSGGLGFPSPQTHPSPSHTLFCPINWHTAQATPPPRPAKWAERDARRVPRFDGNTPCGRNLPAHSPPQWHVLRRESQQPVPAQTETEREMKSMRNKEHGQWVRAGIVVDVARLTNHPIRLAVGVRVTYLWIRVSLLTVASAAFRSGHFTLLLICGRRVTWDHFCWKLPTFETAGTKLLTTRRKKTHGGLHTNDSTSHSLT